MADPATPAKKAPAKKPAAKKPATKAAPKAKAAAAAGNSVRDQIGTTADTIKSEATRRARELREEAASLASTATKGAREAATKGKDKAAETVGSLARMLEDSASTVDTKFGKQYGDYARSAATTVAGLATSLEEKDLDELAGATREFVKKSPAVAVGAAAVIGFVLARMLKKRRRQRRSLKTGVAKAKIDMTGAGAGLGDVRHGFAPTTPHEPAAPAPPLGEIAAGLVADIKATAQSELALIQARAALAGDGVRRAAMWGAIAGGAALIALLAIVFGIIVALVPYVGAVFATLIVGGLLLAVAAFAGLRARAGATDIRAAFAEQGDHPHWKGEA